ncbi:Uncharacterized protein NH340_JMT08687 [Sarcoptes scabiei]|nr:Uncharacterized protein NH340_JMT08687 [Sarcoptes scabiei]
MTNIPDPTFLKCFQNNHFAINSVAFSPNSNFLASASDENNVILWTLNNSNTYYKYVGHKDSVQTVSVADSFMVTGSKDCTARLWRTDERQTSNDGNITSESIIYRCHKSPINCVDISPDETQFCTASDDQTVKIWSCSCANKIITTLNNGHSNWIRHARFSKLNPNLLASSGDDGVICIWDCRSKETAIQLTSKRRSTHFLSVQWHPTCEYVIASSSSDCLIRIWDLRYEKTIQFYQVHNSIVSSSDFHPSGNYLISSSLDQTCKIIDVFEGRTLFTLKAHTGPVNCVSFSSDGKYFASAGQDHVVLLWRSNLPNKKDDKFVEDCDSIDVDVNEKNPINDFNKYSSNKNTHKETKIKQLKKSLDEDRLASSKLLSTKNNLIRNDLSDLNGKLSIDSISASSPTSNGFHLQESSIEILKCVLQQLETITDSILQIDQRLTMLEDKFKRQSIS